MKRTIATIGAAALLIACSAFANAQDRPAAGGQRANPSQQSDAATAEKKTEERRKEAEARRTEAEEQNRSMEMRAGKTPEELAEEGKARGESAMNAGATGEQMRERRDERKAIQDAYRENREAGEDGANPEAEEQDEDEDQKDKEKKPWWKFWQ